MGRQFRHLDDVSMRGGVNLHLSDRRGGDTCFHEERGGGNFDTCFHEGRWGGTGEAAH